MASKMDTYVEELKDFRLTYETFIKAYDNASKKVLAFEKAAAYAQGEPGRLEKEISGLKKQMQILNSTLYGNSSKKEIGEKDTPSIASRLSVAQGGFNTTYGPTAMHMESLQMAKTLFNRVELKLKKFIEVDIPEIENKLIKAGVPPILN